MKCDSSEEYHTEESLGGMDSSSKHMKKKRAMQTTTISSNTATATSNNQNKIYRENRSKQQQQQQTYPISTDSRSHHHHHHHHLSSEKGSRDRSLDKGSEREEQERRRSRSPSKNRHVHSSTTTSKQPRNHLSQPTSNERRSKTAHSKPTRSAPTAPHSDHHHPLPPPKTTTLTRKESKRNISYHSSDDESDLRNDDHHRKSRRQPHHQNPQGQQHDSETIEKERESSSKPSMSQSEHQKKRESDTKIGRNDTPAEGSRRERELLKKGNDHEDDGHPPSSDVMKASRHGNSSSKSAHNNSNKTKNNEQKSKDTRHESSEKKGDSTRRGREGGREKRSEETGPTAQPKTNRDSGSTATITSSERDTEKRRRTNQPRDNGSKSTKNNSHEETLEKTTEHGKDRRHGNDIGHASEHRNRRESERKQQEKPRKEIETSEHQKMQQTNARKTERKENTELGPSEHNKRGREQRRVDNGSNAHGASNRESDRMREDRPRNGQGVDRKVKQHTATGKVNQVSATAKIVPSKHTRDSDPKTQNNNGGKERHAGKTVDPKSSRQKSDTKGGDKCHDQKKAHHRSLRASTSEAPYNGRAKNVDGNPLPAEESIEEHSESDRDDKNEINEQLLLQIKRLLAPSPGEDNQDVEDILDALIHNEAPFGDIGSMGKSTEHSTKEPDISSINMSVNDEDVVTSFNPLKLDVDEELRTFSTPLGLDTPDEAHHGTDRSSWVHKKILVEDEDDDDVDEEDNEDYDGGANEDSTLESGEMSCPSFTHNRQATRLDDELSVNTGVGRSMEPKPILPYDGALTHSDSFDYDGDESAACLKDYVDNSRNGETFDFGLVNNGTSLIREDASPSNHSRRKVTKANRVMQIGKFFHINRRNNPNPSHHDEDARSISSSNSRLFGLIKRHAPLGDFDDDR